MKFQNPSIHHSKVNTHTDRQAQSNMPFQLFQSWGHKYEVTSQSQGLSAYFWKFSTLTIQELFLINFTIILEVFGVLGIVTWSFLVTSCV